MNDENLFNEYMSGNATLEELLSFYKTVENIAKKEDLERFLSNTASQSFMSFSTGVEISILVSSAEKLLELYNSFVT